MSEMMESFFDELEKIGAGKADILKEVAKRWKLPTALIGGATAYHLGEKGLRRYQLGKRLEEQMEARGR